MSDSAISNLQSLPEASVAATDALPIVDISASETKKVTVKDLVEGGVALIDAASIPAAKVGTLGTNQVATAAIQDNAVTAAKIASGTITATEIADTTITGAKLVNDTVTATQIAANAITASELADDAVDTAAIAANAVTTAKITDANVTYAKLSLSDGDIPAAKITGNSITSAQIGTNAVGASELADNSVDTAAVVDAAITGAKIATDTIGSGNIAVNAVGASELADNAVDTASIVANAVTTAKIADNQITAAKLADNLAGTILATGAIGSSQIATNAVTSNELADNAVDTAAIADSAVTDAKVTSGISGTKLTDETVTASKLNTLNIDRSLNVASGNLGINNAVTGGASTRSGITYNAEGLITGTAALAAADLPLATTDAVGGVSVGDGLSVTGTGALFLSNSVTAVTGATKVNYNSNGQITGSSAIGATDLPVATTSAKGAVQITSGGGLTVDGTGNLSTTASGVSAGTYQSVVVNNKGVITSGSTLTAAQIPSLSAEKITSGTIGSARIGLSSIDASKLSDNSTAIFQSVAQSGFPTASYNGQILFDTVSGEAWIFDGTAWQSITTLTNIKGNLDFGGTYNASNNQMISCTAAGLVAGLAVGSDLPTASANTDGIYVVVSVAGTPNGNAPNVALAPPDYILGVTTSSSSSSWQQVDLSTELGGLAASNVSFSATASGVDGIAATTVQAAIEELATEKVAKAGGTISGQILIGHTGSLVFEGSSNDEYELTLAVTNPTADRTLTLPNVTGTLITSGDTDTVTSTMVDASLVDANIASNAGIALSKLATVTSGQFLIGAASTGVVTSVGITGDIAINNSGVASIASGSIVDADVKSDAAIAGSKITTGSTSAVGVLQLTDSVVSTSTTTAATPAAVKLIRDLAIIGVALTTSKLSLDGTTTMTGPFLMGNDQEARFYEATSNGSAYVGIKGATDKGSSGSYTISLPASPPTTGQVLKAGSTATTLEWATELSGSPNITVGTIGCGNITGTGTVSDSKGNLRSIPQNTQGSDYELLATDAGKHILASGNITWVDSRHAAGDVITIVNNTADNITITKGTTMYNTANGNNGNRTLAARGMATILFASETVAYISGEGLS